MNFFESFHEIDRYAQSAKTDKVAISNNFIPTTGLNDSGRLKQISSLLLNAFSAEYALRITPIVNDEHYLQSSLHWTFPQAYYSALFSARAFLSVLGINISNEDVIRRKIGSLTVVGFYPESLSYYANGLPVQRGVKVHRLPKSFNQLADFVIDTRNRTINKRFDMFQCNPKTALRAFQTGFIVKKLSEANLNDLREFGKSIGYTSFLDLLTRLRISHYDGSRNGDLDYRGQQPLDVREFHNCLTRIVELVNGVHETYIAAAIGLDTYCALISKLPSYLQESFVSERFQTVVRPSIMANADRWYLPVNTEPRILSHPYESSN